MENRGFEVISSYKEQSINLPVRKTQSSAGYDIEAAEARILTKKTVTIVPTGLKAYMLSDEYLGVHIRSGFSIKNSLSFINGQGIIDADYYDNDDNEGHIMIAIFNHSDKDVLINKGDRIAQGIFYKYLTVDNDSNIDKEKRQGGFGSTKGF